MSIRKVLFICFVASLFITSSLVYAQTFVTLQNVNPTSGLIDSPITLTGISLGIGPGDVDNCAPRHLNLCNVQFHDINLRRSTVSGTEVAGNTVTANVPTDLCPGSYTIKVGEVLDFSNKIPFIVESPPVGTPMLAGCRLIESVVPNTGLVGTTVTITGINLHENVQLYDDSFGKSDIQGVINGIGTQVTFEIPVGQEPGTYTVRVGPDVTDISNGLPFTVLGDTRPPSIYNIRVNGITTDSASILWDTTEPSDGQLELCTSNTSCGLNSPLQTTLATSHQVDLSSLDQRTYYYFWVKSSDANGNQAIVGPMFFRTRAPNLPYVYSLWVTSRDLTSATVEWKTNVDASSVLEVCSTFARCNNDVAASSPVGRDHSATLTGLTPGTKYYIWAKATSTTGYDAISGLRVFRTLWPPRPYVSSLRVINRTTTSATITWNTNIDSDSQVEFCTTSARCGNNTPLDASLTRNHSVTLTGLTPGTSYYFWIKSRGTAGYLSDLGWYYFRSSRLYPPYAFNIRRVNVDSNTVTISWDTNVDSYSQVEYCTTRDRCLVNTPLNTNLSTSHSATLSGLTPRTYYFYWMKSTDANGIQGDAGYYILRTIR